MASGVLGCMSLGLGSRLRSFSGFRVERFRRCCSLLRFHVGVTWCNPCLIIAVMSTSASSTIVAVATVLRLVATMSQSMFGVGVICHSEVAAWCMSVVQQTDTIELEMSTTIPADIHKVVLSR